MTNLTKSTRAFPTLIASLALAAVFGSLGGATATASPAGEAFVQSTVQHGFELLNDTSLTQTDRDARFRDFLLSVTEVRAVALYTLGRTRLTASEAEQNAFVEAFREYAFAVYGAAFEKYRGYSLRVTGSIERSAGDELVKTVIMGSGSKRDAVEVGFRIKGNNGHLKVMDLVVEGIGFASAKQSEFNAFLTQNGNDIGRLTAMLKARAKGIETTMTVADNRR